MTRAVAAACAVIALAACGRPATAPGDVVALYFASLGRDPLRTLPITSDAFHREHGLRPSTTAEARAFRGSAAFESAAPARVDEAQVAWLAIQGRAEFGRTAAALRVGRPAVQEDGDAATVAVSVAGERAPPFRQVFRLTRSGPGAAWRIDSIEQDGVEPENETAAFVAHPTEAARRALAARVRAPRGEN